MRLRALFEGARHIEPTINIFTAPEEDVRFAFDYVEYEGFYDHSMGEDRLSIKSWYKYYEAKKEKADDLRAEIDRVKAGGRSDTPEYYEDEGMSREEIIKELEKYYNGEGSMGYGPGAPCGEAIYGSGGWNRFFIRFGGGIWLSAPHAPYPRMETIQNALDVGIGVFNLT